jgi:hypothetical protein
MLRSSSVKVLFHACYTSRRVASCRAYSILQFFSPLDSSWVDSRFPGDCFFAETSSSLSPQSTLGLPFGWQALPRRMRRQECLSCPALLFHNLIDVVFSMFGKFSDHSVVGDTLSSRDVLRRLPAWTWKSRLPPFPTTLLAIEQEAHSGCKLCPIVRDTMDNMSSWRMAIPSKQQETLELANTSGRKFSCAVKVAVTFHCSFGPDGHEPLLSLLVGEWRGGKDDLHTSESRGLLLQKSKTEKESWKRVGVSMGPFAEENIH